MDHYGVCIILLTVGIKMFYRYVLERRGVKLSLSFMPGFMSRREDWIVVCPIRLVTIAILVSLFCCVQVVHQDLNKVHGLTMKLKYDDFYKSLVFSLFILFSIQLQTPLLMGPWLNFTLKHFLTTEMPSLGKYFNDLPHQHIVSTIVLYALTTYILLMQIQWWLVICNYHSFLWTEIINVITSKPVNKSPQYESEELVNDKHKINEVIT